MFLFSKLKWIVAGVALIAVVTSATIIIAGMFYKPEVTWSVAAGAYASILATWAVAAGIRQWGKSNGSEMEEEL